jgi:ubiquinone/menaquinone biosynthesis C-methylase UbiE
MEAAARGTSSIVNENTNVIAATDELQSLLRCVTCGARLDRSDGALACTGCDAAYPVVQGTVCVDRQGTGDEAELAVKRLTADSFAYEWEQFGQRRPEWRKNFLDYLRPHDASFLDGRLVLDVGTGSGRHSREAADLGARVVAADLGDAIHVARRNLPEHVLTVQADAERLPLAPDTFDLVMSIGVLHHLPDTERALCSLVRYAKPGGWLHVYLYWQPERASHRAVLRAVNAARRVTTRMPHRLLHALCYPLAAALWVTVVKPYGALRRRPRGRRLADVLPLKTYADYPFAVLVNDQFDRFSAPIEQRFTRAEVETMLRRAGLADVQVLPNHGWVGSGRRPR